MWKNIVEPGRSYMTAWRICIACWFPKATIHTLRICNTHCFSTVSVVAWTRLVVTINVQCLSCLVSYPSLYVRTFLAVSYLMFYNKVFYAFFFPTRVTWRDYPILFDVTIIIIQSDSFGTRPKKMRISERLFIRFWTCIYDYIPCFMRSMLILEEMLEMLATTVQAELNSTLHVCENGLQDVLINRSNFTSNVVFQFLYGAWLVGISFSF